MDVKNTTHEDLAQIIGFSSTLRLAAYYGGRNLTVPRNVSEQTVLAKVIGLSAAKMLSTEFAGECLWVPTLHIAEVEMRNAKVLEQLRNGYGTDQVAANAGLSVRRVQQLRLQFEAMELLPKILGKNDLENLGENHD
jgi:hypothetical protein